MAPGDEQAGHPHPVSAGNLHAHYELRIMAGGNLGGLPHSDHEETRPIPIGGFGINRALRRPGNRRPVPLQLPVIRDKVTEIIDVRADTVMTFMIDGATVQE